MRTDVGKPEIASQKRVLKLFKSMGYAYLGDWEEEIRSQPVEENILKNHLLSRGYSEVIVQKVIDKFVSATINLSSGLYEANKQVYQLLRYGVTIREELGKAKETVWLIDWRDIESNQFAVAEEVTFQGRHTKRPDIVIYVNGIALGVIELKRSKVGVEQGIRQNLDNQKDMFIPKFFTAMQLVMAGNDSQGLRYGTIETPEKFYLTWKEKSDKEFDYVLDKHISLLCEKKRLLEIIHDFVVYDKGVKKLCRPNQYFGIKAAQSKIINKQGGILWHTQGSGKSLTMVWLTKWIRENITDSRVLIITDREELDDQIEKLFIGIEEKIYRTKSGNDLIDKLNHKTEMLICSLVHKFGRVSENGDYNSFIDELNSSLTSDFKAKGNIHVFVDECHRTQSGILHDAMKKILPDALFIGYTGTPLLKKDKQKSIEVFGPYIGDPYKFDEAVEDGVVLDLLYEARDVEQFVTDQRSVDEWFDAETSGLTDVAKIELKNRWGTLQKVLGSRSRLEKIVFDIIKDFKVKPRLSSGEGNAILVSGTVYHACKYYELFQRSGFNECAIITSYEPYHGDVRGEETGEDNPTDKLLKYEVYNKMLNGKSSEEFEKEVKKKFKNEPSRMKLLIVVDKLLTGFDAPSATYLYIDKSMQDHGLFQAICRVNRIDGESKEYGYIIDYKDLFRSLKKSISDYTSEVFDGFEDDDVKGLLKNRLNEIKEKFESSLEAVKAICESVHPKDEPQFIKYFCGNTENPNDIKDTEEKRIALYKSVSTLIRAYSNIANELNKLGYSLSETESIKEEVRYYSDLSQTIKQASGDYVDFKRFEPGMRQLMDMYIDSNSSKKISDFENNSLTDLINTIGDNKSSMSNSSKLSVAETIENNIRKAITEKLDTNPKYYEKMSEVLAQLIDDRKNDIIDYIKYLEEVKRLAEDITSPSQAMYPKEINSTAKQSLYDNLENDVDLVLNIDKAIKDNKLDNWRDGGIKEKKLKIAVNKIIKDLEKTEKIFQIIKSQNEY